MSSYDIVGDIAVIRIPKSLPDELELTAERLMQRHETSKQYWDRLAEYWRSQIAQAQVDCWREEV